MRPKDFISALKLACLGAVLLLGTRTSLAVSWLPFGPDGGDARSLAQGGKDHRHLYLGTVNGWIYDSNDGGGHWRRLARIGNRDDLVLDNIIVDAANPRHILAGTWVLGRSDGGLFVSNDAGVTWTANAEMNGQSIRALAASSSNPKLLVAGTLQGVFRSIDGGEHWQRISPAGSQELHEVESIAIDPVNPQIIYAGTWHLPWKTTDGGAHWNNIKQGIIDDSDVFSIIVDPKKPSTVYASACSGIYKSEDAGSKFLKIQGIPSTARRTRVLMQDPEHLETVFAGTTEGLFRSDDSGKTWFRITGPEVIVNDVFIDPTDSKRVLIATDRGGVLASNDRGNSFDSSNLGFSARQVTSYIADREHPADVYIGLVNDKIWGGVFASNTGGLSWNQQSSGLLGRDVFSLAQASDGTILSGTSHGIYRLQSGMWQRVTNVAWSGRPSTAPDYARSSSGHDLPGRRGIKPVSFQQTSKQRGADYDGSIASMAQSGDTLYAGIEEGLLESTTAGQSWNLLAGLHIRNVQHVAAAGSLLFVAGLKQAEISPDQGKNWRDVKLPDNLTQVAAIAVTPTGELWVGGREGLFYSASAGASWLTLPAVSIRDVNSLFYDSAGPRILATVGGTSTLAYAVHLPDHSVRFWETGWNLRFVRPVGDHLVGATLFDGIVVQPRMVDSQQASAK